MKKILFNKIWIRVLEIFIGILFIYSGILKIINPIEFSLTVAKYGILPEKVINFFSYTIPFFEITSGFFLISGLLIRGASFTLLFLLTIFTSAIIYVTSKGFSFECGCFEILGRESRTGILSILRNLILLALTLNIFIFSIKSQN